MSSDLIHRSGLATILGGVLLACMFLSRIPDALVQLIGSYTDLYFVPLVLLLAGLVGLRARMKTGSKHGAKVGFFLSFLGAALAAASNLAWKIVPKFAAYPTLGTITLFTFLGGIVVLSIGMILIGIATTRAKVLPRWNDSPLIIGVLGFLGIPLFTLVAYFVLAYFSTSTATSGLLSNFIFGAIAIFGVSWVALGYALWSYADEITLPAAVDEESRNLLFQPRMVVPFVRVERYMERISKWLNDLAFLDILESLGKLTILVAVIYFLLHVDDQERQRHYEAWQTITGAQEQEGTGGRIDAIQELNEEGESLVGLSAEKAFLKSIDLEGANLSSAKLQGADLTAANLRKATLWSADLDKARLGKGVDGKVAILEEANLERAYLRETDLQGADLRGAVLDEAKLDKASLSGADLQDAKLNDAILKTANLRPTDDQATTNLERAVLTGANLYGAKLAEADLREAQFDRAILGTAVLSDADLQGAVFVGADLSKASLSGANLQDADFQDAVLTGADIRNDTDLRGAKNLTQEQVNVAKGDETTQLPDGFERPAGWDLDVNNLPTEGEIAAGDYNSEEFQIPFSFSTEGGWEVTYPEVDNYTALSYEGDGEMTFTLVRKVFDPEEPTLENTVSSPDDMVGWFQEHPNLDIIGKPAPVKIGNASGVQFDVVASSTPDDYPQQCKNPCVPLFPLSDGGWLRYFEGEPHRVIILEFEGAPVIISIDPTCSCLPRARELLESMSWGFTKNLSADEHSSEEHQFQIPFSFSVGEGWQAVSSGPDSFALTPGIQEDLTTLNFFVVQKVYDPTKPTLEAENIVPAPDDMVGWFQKHRYLNVEKPEPIKVGGKNGVVFNASVRTVPVDYPSASNQNGCNGPCVPLFKSSDGGAYNFLEGYTNRVILLEVGGETVLISIESPSNEFDEFLPKAEGVLKTVKWGG